MALSWRYRSAHPVVNLLISVSMIILDTNVISEIMRPEPADRVLSWLADQAPQNLAITTITIAEIDRGLARLPNGKRRIELEERFTGFVTEGFKDRILPFDREAAFAYGNIANEREQQGLHVDAIDLMIAAIAKTTKAKIATRNTSDFEACGLSLDNPWKTL